METNTLGIIQTLAKIGRVISKVIFIICLVCFCLCICGIISLAAGAQKIDIGGVTISGMIEDEAGVSVGTMYAGMTVAAILLAAECVLAKFSEHYFNRELGDGTPFTLGGSKELMRLGILAVCIPIGARIIASIVTEIFEKTMSGVELMDMGSSGSVAIGVMMIVGALICRYGAERTNGDTI